MIEREVIRMSKKGCIKKLTCRKELGIWYYDKRHCEGIFSDEIEYVLYDSNIRRIKAFKSLREIKEFLKDYVIFCTDIPYKNK